MTTPRIEHLSDTVTLYLGDCLDVLPTLDRRVESVITDPPYGLSFLGRSWDHGVPGIPFWEAILAATLPGGTLLAFGGTRTSHRLVCAIEDAGWEIRDALAWVYGKGMPKSNDISKAIDKAAGAEREVVGDNPNNRPNCAGRQTRSMAAPITVQPITAPATDAAKQWDGWGTALKPSHEDIAYAQKPLDLQGLCCILARKIGGTLCQLPSFVRDAERRSMSSPSGSDVGACDSVLWTAVEKCSTLGDLFALMDTLQSGSAIPTTLSIGLSWLDTLAAISQAEKTSTIETTTGLTIDLRTLNCSQSAITPESIIEAATCQRGIGSSAGLAESIFNAARMKLACIPAPSAQGLATSPGDTLDLRPSLESICLAMAPLDGTFAANALKHGVAGLNVDGARVGTSDKYKYPNGPGGKSFQYSSEERSVDVRPNPTESHPDGRWPANLILQHSPECRKVGARKKKYKINRYRGAGPFGGGASHDYEGTDVTTKEDVWECVEGCPTTFFPESTSGSRAAGVRTGMGYHGADGDGGPEIVGSTGSAARFFKQCAFAEDERRLIYCAKASSAERGAYNDHPTVKPIALMAYLCELTKTPTGGTVLDPFMGSGSTGVAAVTMGRPFIGIEQDEHSFDIAKRRISEAIEGDLLTYSGAI